MYAQQYYFCLMNIYTKKNQKKWEEKKLIIKREKTILLHILQVTIHSLNTLSYTQKNYLVEAFKKNLKKIPHKRWTMNEQWILQFKLYSIECFIRRETMRI